MDVSEKRLQTCELDIKGMMGIRDWRNLNTRRWWASLSRDAMIYPRTWDNVIEIINVLEKMN